MTDIQDKLHPHFKRNNVAALGQKNPVLESEFFGHKFKSSFLKLVLLKGVDLRLKEQKSDKLFNPALESTFKDILCLPLVLDQKTIGHLYLEQSIVAILLHYILGGHDKIIPLPQKFPLSAMNEKALASCYGLLGLSIREGLKRNFKLFELDFFEVCSPLNEVDFKAHLEMSSRALVEEFIFEGPSHHQEGKITVLFQEDKL